MEKKNALLLTGQPGMGKTTLIQLLAELRQFAICRGVIFRKPFMSELNYRKGTNLLTRDFILVCLASVGTFAGFSFLAPTLPVYIVEIGGNTGDIGLIVGILTIASAITRPFIGRIVDRRGSKDVLVAGSFFLVLSAVLYLLARNIPALFVLRIFHGGALGAAGTAAYAFIAAVSPPHRRGEAMGVYGLFFNLSFVAGPMAGSLLAERYGFFALFLGMGAISAMGLALVLPIMNPKASTPPLDRRQSAFISRSVLVPSLVFFCMTSAFAPILVFLPLFAMERSLGNVGVFFGLQAAAAFLVQAPAGKLSDIYGRPPVIVAGLFFIFSGMALLAFSFSNSTFFGAAFILGVGAAAVQVSLLALAVDYAGEGEQGAAMATTTAAADFGIGVGSFVWGFLTGILGYSTTFIGAGTVALAGLVAFLAWLKRQ